MFTTLIVQPIFNLLVFIYAMLPGHNFGLAIILFTVIVRLLMWPLVKKQLHHAKAMRALQPELKRIKQETKGDKQKESVMVMELYKERQINPFSSIGILIVQIPILIGLYSGIHRVVNDPQVLVDFAYPAVRDLPWMKQLAGNIHLFDHSLVHVVDLYRPALAKGVIYPGAMLIVLGGAIAQYFQSKQLMPTDKDAKSLRHLLRQASGGTKADNTEINAAVGRSTRYILPVMIFIFTVRLASALSLYLLVGGLVALVQQSRVLKQDEGELEVIADAPAKANSTNKTKTVIEGEVVAKKPTTSSKKSKSVSKAKKRRK